MGFTALRKLRGVRVKNDGDDNISNLTYEARMIKTKTKKLNKK